MAYKRYLRSKYGRSMGYAYGRGKKWSTESCCKQATYSSAGGTIKTEIVPGTSVQGVRKVGYFTVNLASSDTQANNLPAIYWALVYVPEGGTASSLNITQSDDIYQPSNYVLSSGVWQPGSQNRFKVAGLRKLNAGDRIYMVSIPMGTITNNQTVNIVCQYKISF